MNDFSIWVSLFFEEFGRMKNFFPMMQLALCVLASATYAISAEYYNTLYWGGASVISYAVIFKPGV